MLLFGTLHQLYITGWLAPITHPKTFYGITKKNNQVVCEHLMITSFLVLNFVKGSGFFSCCEVDFTGVKYCRPREYENY